MMCRLELRMPLHFLGEEQKGCFTVSVFPPFSSVAWGSFYECVSRYHAMYVCTHICVYLSNVLTMYVCMRLTIRQSVHPSIHLPFCLLSSFAHFVCLFSFLSCQNKLLVFPVRMNNEAVFFHHGMSIFLLSGLFR